MVELLSRMDEDAAAWSAAPASGYLQFVRHSTLVRIAAEHGRGDPAAAPARALRRARATRWRRSGRPGRPASGAGCAARAHHRARTGRSTQDVAFAIDQLVEIAIRALSPAVNDTFTALTCIDWLGDGLCQIACGWARIRCAGTGDGLVRLIMAPVSYDRLVERAYEKVREASAGMPAVMIRQLAALVQIIERRSSPSAGCCCARPR